MLIITMQYTSKRSTHTLYSNAHCTLHHMMYSSLSMALSRPGESNLGSTRQRAIAIMLSISGPCFASVSINPCRPEESLKGTGLLASS